MPEEPKPYDEERRLKAETRKLEAEALKLEAEANDLNRTPWERPGTWVALGSAVVAIVAGLITIPSGYFSRVKTIAEQQEQISKQAVEAAQTKLDLSMAQDEARVQHLNEQLASAARQRAVTEEQQQQSLKRFQREEADARANLAKQQGLLQTAKQEQERLQRDIALAPLNGLLTRLESAFAQPSGVQYTDTLRQMIDDIISQLRQKDALAPARLALVQDERAKEVTKPLFSGLLLHALYQTTGDSALRDQLFDIARNNAFQPEQLMVSWPALPLELVLGGQYDDRDKAGLTCSLTNSLISSRLDASAKAGRMYILAAQDPRILDICPAPFIKAIQMNRDLAASAYLNPGALPFAGLSPIQHFTAWMSKVIGLSTEAASVYIADLTRQTGQDLIDYLFVQVNGQTGPILSLPRYYFLNKYDMTWAPIPAPFGRTRPLMKPSEWPQWLADHKALTAFWLEPDLGTLAAKSDFVKKVVRGGWLDESEIPTRQAAVQPSLSPIGQK